MDKETKIFTEIETDTHHKPHLKCVYLTYVSDAKLTSLNDKPTSFCMEVPFTTESAKTIIDTVLSNLEEPEEEESDLTEDGYCPSCGYPGCDGGWACPGAY